MQTWVDKSTPASTLTTVKATITTVSASTAFTVAGTGTAAQSFTGTYARNTFASDADGKDTLLVYDNNGSDAGGANETVILVGITAVGTPQ